LFGRIDIDDATAYYWYTVVVALVVFAAVIGIRRSRTGRAIIAVRDNERAAQSFSIGAVRAKLTAFTISGVIAGIGGALFVHLNQAFSLDSYAGGQNVAVFASSVVGGLGSVGGAVLGAAYLRGMQWFITSNEWYFLSTAAGVLLVLLLLPGGLVSLCVRARDAYVGWLLRRSDGVPSASTTAAGTKAAAQPADAVTGPTADDVATVEASR